MGRGSDQSEPEPSTEEIIEMFPSIAQSLMEVARRAGTSPTDVQSNFWNQALHSS